MLTVIFASGLFAAGWWLICWVAARDCAVVSRELSITKSRCIALAQIRDRQAANLDKLRDRYADLYEQMVDMRNRMQSEVGDARSALAAQQLEIDLLSEQLDSANEDAETVRLELCRCLQGEAHTP